ncbi:phosphopantetheine-binding protein [Pseudomonas aeruginosa]|nr:phosphopantetheine-binding protein [Pseudomonas aeruginosa]
MVPAHLLLLASLPLHRQRQARPPRAAGARPGAQPAGLYEARAACWSSNWPGLARGAERRAGRPRGEDNFFELGGDSILSIQVVAAPASSASTAAPCDLFQHQTVQSLAVARAGTARSARPSRAGAGRAAR